jgi:hypothetical protein
MRKILKKFLKDIIDKSYFWFFTLCALTLHLSKYDLLLFAGNFTANMVILIIVSLIANRFTFAVIFTVILNIILKISADLKSDLLATTLNLSDVDFIFHVKELAGEDLILSYMTKSFVIYFAIILTAIFFFLKHSSPMVNMGRSFYQFILKRLIMLLFAVILWKGFVAVISTNKISVNNILDYAKERNIENCKNQLPQHNTKRAKCYSMGPVLDIMKGISEPNLIPLNFSEDSAYIKKLISENKGDSGNREKIQPNIFLILNESIFDPQDLDYDLGSNKTFTFFNSQDIIDKGYLKVHTFGGGSSLSEYPSLTGILHDVFDGPNSYPFLNMAEYTKSSIFTELKKAGYYNIVIYPNKKDFLNARKAFKMLGADRIVDVEDYGFSSSDWRNVSEELISNIISEEIKLAPQNMPVFLSVATMRNHGPHDKNYPDKIGCRDLMDMPLCSKLNDYLTKLKMIDQEWEIFHQNLKKSAMKYILIHFGDHRPSFEGKMDFLKFKFRDSETNDIFRTFFTVRSNMNLANFNYPIMDISFIPSLILDYINSNESEFYQASSYVRRKCNGLLDNCQDLKLVNSFKSLMTEQIEFLNQH